MLLIKRSKTYKFLAFTALFVLADGCFFVVASDPNIDSIWNRSDTFLQRLVICVLVRPLFWNIFFFKLFKIKVGKHLPSTECRDRTFQLQFGIWSFEDCSRGRNEAWQPNIQSALGKSRMGAPEFHNRWRRSRGSPEFDIRLGHLVQGNERTGYQLEEQNLLCWFEFYLFKKKKKLKVIWIENSKKKKNYSEQSNRLVKGVGKKPQGGAAPPGYHYQHYV